MSGESEVNNDQWMVRYKKDDQQETKIKGDADADGKWRGEHRGACRLPWIYYKTQICNKVSCLLLVVCLSVCRFPRTTRIGGRSSFSLLVGLVPAEEDRAVVTLIRLRATRRCLNYLIAAFVLCHLLGSDFPHLLRVPRPTDPICIMIISERACAVGVGV